MNDEIEHVFNQPGKSSDRETLVAHNHVDSEARIEAMATRVSKWDLMKTVIIEELPQPHILNKFTTIYLIPESLVCFYLLFCLVYIDRVNPEDPETYSGPNNYTDAVAAFTFFCCIPFLALRVISLICCKSTRLIVWQVFGIWFTNLFAYAVWSLYALVEIILEEDGKGKWTLDFANTVGLLVILCTSICAIICGLPMFIFKLHERATNEQAVLSHKVAKIKLLPRVKYSRNIHTSLTFCTICGH